MVIVSPAAGASVPPVITRVAVGATEVSPLVASVAPLSNVVPAPRMLAPVSVWVPPAKSTTLPAAGVNVPVSTCPPLPPLRRSVPVLALTVPSFSNGTLTLVVPVPADFVSVPPASTWISRCRC